MEPLGEEQELFLSRAEVVARAGNLRSLRVLADCREAHVLLLQEVPHTHKIEVRRHVDESVRHHGVPVLRENLLHEELEPGGSWDMELFFSLHPSLHQKQVEGSSRLSPVTFSWNKITFFFGKFGEVSLKTKQKRCKNK